jgi:hypothetical protein
MKHLRALPHGGIQTIFPDIFFVKGAMKMPMLMPMKISRSMTVLRDSETGDLTVVNSMRLSPGGFEALDKLGRFVNVIRLAGFHGRDDGFFRERYGAKIFAIRGQSYTRKLDGKTPAKNYMVPDVWLDEASPLAISGASLRVLASSTPSEAVLRLEAHGGILIAGDALQHTPAPDEFVNLPARVVMKRMGFYKPHAVGAGWLQFASPTEQDVRSLLDLDFEHVLPAHGDAVIGGAKGLFRPAIEGPLKGCHEDGEAAAA